MDYYNLYKEAIPTANLEELRDLGWQIITNADLEKDELFELSDLLIGRWNEVK